MLSHRMMELDGSLMTFTAVGTVVLVSWRKGVAFGFAGVSGDFISTLPRPSRL